MKKRILSLLLAFLMAFSMIPGQTFAADGAEEPTETPTEAPDAHAAVLAEVDNTCCTMYNGIHDATCENYICPNCGTGPWHDVCPEIEEPPTETPTEPAKHPMIGKLVAASPSAGSYYEAPGENMHFVNNIYFADRMEIVAVGEKSGTTYYQLKASGCNWKADSLGDVLLYDGIWVKESYVVLLVYCEVCKDYNCGIDHSKPEDNCDKCDDPECDGTKHVKCEICGKYDCDTVHLYCQLCNKHDCGKEHLFCLVCKKYDCSLTHTYCGYCNDYDCGIEHLGMNKPAQTPEIPANPTLPDDVDVSIVDEAGDLVTEAGLRLSRGMRTSLSAWSDEENASYQWQVHVDDQWINIQGQTEKGILVSPAMFIPLIEAQGSAEIRCVITSAAGTKNSDPIPVSIQSAASVASFARKAGVLPIAETDDPGELTKSYVVVQYQYADGRTAAASDFAELVPGSAYEHTYDLPDIPGYKATLNTHSYGTSAGIVDGNLVLDFAQNVLGDGYTIFTVTYVPDYVKFTVIHYWQNVEDDYYTEKARETVTNKYKTGDLIAEAHKSYPGFYNLLYETPYAAADGSTVIEVYYDRYYYLMTFDLGENGYGVDPVYARYGDTLDIKTPTRAGYTFLGWKLNGTGDTIASADMPTTMPAQHREYVAQWQAADKADVSVVIWGENPNDEGYSYQKTINIEAKPGDAISWDTYSFNCGNKAHTHNSLCGYGCGKEEHIHDSDCYVLTCTTAEHTSHTDSCYACGRQEHTEHTDECCKWGGIHWWHDNNCCTLGGTHTHSASCRYKCTLHAHTMADECYTVACGKNEHPHTADCGYSCGVTQEHVHSTSCGTDQSGMTRNLWTMVRSETAIVEAAGTTVLNVYYDRTEFTLTFRKNSSTVKTIREKWGADIHSEFPIKNSNNTMWWTVPNGCSSMKPGTQFGSLDTMPAENITFTYSDETQSATLHYYVEALPGEDGKKASEIYSGFTGNSIDQTKKFKSYKDINVSTSGYLTYTEEFHNITGFRQYVSYPKFDKHEQGGRTSDIKKDNYLMYARNAFDIVFYNPSDLIKTEEDVPYQMLLSNYYWEPTSAVAPDIYEPGSVQFAGWYLNPEGTGVEFDFSTNTMPAGPNNINGESALALYAKWEPVEYRVNYYLTKDSLDRGENIPTEMARLVQEAIAAGKITGAPETDPYTTVFVEKIVQHGAYIGKTGDPKASEGYDKIHPRAGYEFIGWFYLDENGEETAFKPENMPVMQHLNLYGKWSADKLCQYNVYFALDVKNNQTGAAGSDGIADVDENGKTIYIAKPVTGSGIVDRTYTFFAKGGEELNEGYREGYFPTVGSHSILIDIADEQGVGANSYTFLYQQKQAVPYTVKYVDKATGESVKVNGTPVPDKVVSDNKNVVVTENFAYIQGYMPDDYQKTLVVTAGGTNEIIFLYTKDEEHALYVVNYYIQELNSDLSHKGWAQYTNLQSTGNIGTTYSAEAINIAGFTLSASYTDRYNRAETINGMTGNNLPTTPISALTDGKLSGKLSDKGMELNFYYTRNLYPYEFRYMLNGTTTKLADTELGIAGYDTNVTGVAKEIVKDLDGDGINEDYRLYDPTETTKDIHIITDGKPLEPNAEVKEGDATVNVATFYYVRCTQTMTITKELLDRSAESDPDPNLEFEFSLLIHAKNGYHRNSYDYTKSDGTSGTLNYVISAPNTLKFTLKAGQTITIEGLPTAEYTLSELNLPTGYYNTAGTGVRNRLTVESQLDLTVINTYGPANLILQKLVTKEYEGDTLPDDRFTFTVTLADKTAESYTYKLYDKEGQQVGDARTASVTNGVFTVTLEAGQYAVVPNMPVCGYTVSENVNTADYNASYKVYVAESSNGASTGVASGAASASGTGASVSGTFAAGKTDTVVFTNEYKRQLSSLTINKLVTGTGKQDTFIFHITGNGVDMDVTITGSGSVTICDLPLGSYTVTEDTDWSWRYSADKTAVSVDLKNNPDAEVTFTNTYSNNRWLDYAADMPNTFGGKKLRIRRR